MKTAHKVAVGTLAGVVAGALLWGFALAQTPGETVTPSPKQSPPAPWVGPGTPWMGPKMGRGWRHFGPLGRFGRNAFEIQGKVKTDQGIETYRVDQGTVAEVRQDSLVIERADGQKVTIPVQSGTRIVKGCSQASLSDIKAGDWAAALRVTRADGSEETLMVKAWTPGQTPQGGTSPPPSTPSGLLGIGQSF